MTIRCKNGACGRSHGSPFLYCPNCGHPLIEVRCPADGESIEFRGDGWSKGFLIRVSGQLVAGLTNPILGPGGLWFDDRSSCRRKIGALALYNQIADPKRELLSV